MTRRDPDYEMQFMQRGLRDLARLSPPGRRRVLAYWCARAETLPSPEPGDDHGAQQLDIEADVPQGAVA